MNRRLNSYELEEQLERGVFALVRWLAKHVWNVADRVFKLLSWLVAISGLVLLHASAPLPQVLYLAWVLGFLWFFALLVSFFEMMNGIQGVISERFGERNLRNILINVLAALCLTLFSAYFIYEFMFRTLPLILFALIQKAGGS